MRGLHRCPHQLLLVSPPPRSAPACRQSATASSRGLRSSLAVFSAPGARVAAAAREQKWGHVEGDEYGGEEGLGEALHRTRELVECAMFAAVAGLAYFLSNSLAIEVALLPFLHSPLRASSCIFLVCVVTVLSKRNTLPDARHALGLNSQSEETTLNEDWGGECFLA